MNGLISRMFRTIQNLLFDTSSPDGRPAVPDCEGSQRECAQPSSPCSPLTPEQRAAEIADAFVVQLEQDIEPATGFLHLLNKPRNRPTVEHLLKKGRTTIKEIAKSI